MGEWKPTIGKWNDSKNYDIDEPTWRQVLNLARKYRDVSDVIEVLTWIYNRGIENCAWNEYIAAYGLIGETPCTEDELCDIIFSRGTAKVIEFTKNSSDLEEYAENVFRSTELPEAIISEFRARR
ncbi:MAG: hypothetical protein PHD70_07550 [Anaerostipes sp.]|uniref:Uncharacterized protein n=1 Tax=Hespellia stercorisuis DSM 15480 TaxID=1121950 RepID=A0A1M6VMF0_9FIRM|nr:hypothetical protein [Hespellia stercorisuis]MDD3186298.1 hypothetical protein [Anaerostipes sp.]MDD3746308.1 hypothetical protein [Anaerostipes sp.]SHK82672.1 hypothetical protein SAMN02745243_03809 [Hespellia stercorisuis DSM 15480]